MSALLPSAHNRRGPVPAPEPTAPASARPAQPSPQHPRTLSPSPSLPLSPSLITACSSSPPPPTRSLNLCNSFTLSAVQLLPLARSLHALSLFLPLSPTLRLPGTPPTPIPGLQHRRDCTHLGTRSLPAVHCSASHDCIASSTRFFFAIVLPSRAASQPCLFVLSSAMAARVAPLTQPWSSS